MAGNTDDRVPDSPIFFASDREPTKRETIAAMAMQGFISRNGSSANPYRTALDSVEYADALISQLEKPKE